MDLGSDLRSNFGFGSGSDLRSNITGSANSLHTIHFRINTGGPRIVQIQTVRFHYSAVNFLVPKYSIL